ncbi:roadblock/LC7 domain-containing protein [Nocardia asteroides]|uniref:roadblock/LC7 domain-containing protein n=1 Tax=Nocardia asteroides TaxID=1824 RepID=UPI001E5EBEA0|nr:roadblock/LC7 domain-containing protein [Nocardia asteroides]UGT61380.1 roadblock/LC7 domain-containing protein [Nocardia asteroides]
MSRPVERVEVALRDPAVAGKLLQRAVEEIDDVAHAIMTTRDGLVIAANRDADGPPGADTIAARGSAMAAAASGIGDHFTDLVRQGRLHASVFEAERGCVGVFPISATLLLVVAGGPAVTMGRFNAAAKRVLALLQAPDA